MKGKQGLSGVAILAISVLFFATIFLFIQNNHYRNVNRQLILKNDSIISVNIHLKDTLAKETGVNLSINKPETN